MNGGTTLRRTADSTEFGMVSNNNRGEVTGNIEVFYPAASMMRVFA